MALIRKDQPGNAPGYSWTEPGQAVEVDDDMAVELLRIPGFSEVAPEAASAVTEPAPEPDDTEQKPRRQPRRTEVKE